MKKTLFTFGLAILLAGFLAQPASSQDLLHKLKKKAENAVIKKTPDEEKQTQEAPSESTPPAERPSNTRGGGLSKAAPDVKANIADASTAFDGKKYTDARFDIRQAILGIELEIGQNILKGLPDKIAGLPKADGEDNVTSSGIGFVGLVIKRVYRGGDQEFTVTVGNDAAMLSAVNMYLASGAYATNSNDQNYKQIKFEDNRAVIEYDESSGYKLSVPFGQSSILVTEGVNFSNEDDFINASSAIDINNIKKQLGEQ
jgi:hypothetical protein